MIDRQKILDEAKRCVADRQDTHGHPEDVFQAIADLWTAYLHALGLPGELSAAQVAQMMVLFKVARTTSNQSVVDHYVDAAGYSAIAAELIAKGSQG